MKGQSNLAKRRRGMKIIDKVLFIFMISRLLLGSGFVPNVAVTSGGGIQQMPDLAVGEDGSIYVVWLDATVSEGKIYFSKSTDHGVSFEHRVQVSGREANSVSILSGGPRIAEHDGVLYIVWSDQRMGYSYTNIRFTKSEDGGATWSSSSEVGTAGRFNLYADLTVADDGTLHLWYYQYSSLSLDFESVKYRQSTDGGATFTSPKKLNNYSGSVPCECCPADLVILSGGKKLTAFRDNDDNIRDIYGVFSEQGSTSWGDLFRISFQDFFIDYCPSSGPSIGIHENIVAVGYMVGVESVPRVFLKYSTDNAVTFGDSIAVDGEVGIDVIQDYPTTAMTSDGVIHIAWQDSRGRSDIYYGNMTTLDSELKNIEILNDDGADKQQREPKIAAGKDGYVYAVWTDRRSGTEIYFTTNNPASLATDPEASLPVQFRLHQNTPNPFNPATTIRYDLPQDGYVNLAIYDILGKKVRTLVSQKVPTGFHQVEWDGSDDLGSKVSAGVYLYHLDVAPEGSEHYGKTEKMLLLK